MCASALLFYVSAADGDGERGRGLAAAAGMAARGGGGGGVLCSQSIIFREESRWIKVASCHFGDARQIPADRVNTAAGECVRAVSPLYQPVSLYCFFNLPLTFFSCLLQ